MSTEKKAQAILLYRSLLLICVLASTGMLGFALWAFDARVKEVGDTRYVQKNQYQIDLTATQRKIDQHEAEILNIVRHHDLPERGSMTRSAP